MFIFLLKMGSEGLASKGGKLSISCDTLYLDLPFVAVSVEEMKILKVISRVNYFCSMSPGRFTELKHQFWLESPLKRNLNSLWHRMFIYLTDADSIAPDCLA